MTNENNKNVITHSVRKPAFSLAEAMVVLVIIAIVMAMAAPLIAHKANADQKRLIYLGVNSHIATAMGNNQNFGIGDRNPSDAKLTVKATTTTNNKSLIAQFISNFVISQSGLSAEQQANRAKNVIFEVKPNTDAYTTANGNPNGFQVFADGTTNFPACIPDYNRGKYISTSLPCGDVAIDGTNCFKYDTAERGYIYTQRSLKLYKNTDLEVYKDTDNDDAKLIFHSAMMPQFDTEGKVNGYRYYGHMFIPVEAGTRSVIFFRKIGDYHLQDENGTLNSAKSYFFPCVK